MSTWKVRPVLALVLAAGAGVRMAPLSSERPKALIPTLDAPQLSWVLALLSRAGIRRGWVNAHTDPGLIEAVVAQQAAQRGMTLSVSHERESPLGTAGAIRPLAAELTETFLVANADVATDLAVERLLQAHASAKAPATVLAIPAEDDADLI